jgi:glyoxylase-like metal-dependent hydrolase (beta-lactamase superfamily II)
MDFTEPEVYLEIHHPSGTWQYLIVDPTTRQAVIIDSVLDFDPMAQKVGTVTPNKLLRLAKRHNATVTRLLETHTHGDHLTAARYIQQKLASCGQPKPEICAGNRMRISQSSLGSKYGIDPKETEYAFDRLFEDNEIFQIGNLQAQVLFLPGHTVDHVGYKVGSNVFIGDSLWNPDVGTSRCDIAGGSAGDLFQSIRTTLFKLPGHFKLYTGHDFPPESRDVIDYRPYTTVKEQLETNKHVNKQTVKDEFVKWRSEIDATLGEPSLLHHALQFNIRGGRLPRPTEAGNRLIHIPVRIGNRLANLMDGVYEPF